MGSLPPGFRFHPTDEELVGYYLKRKVEGEEIELEVIPVVDFYKHDPWELPDKSFLPRKDMEWFFFSPRDKKYPNGSRTNRATKSGYWKATGKDRKVVSESSIIGYRKTLVFYQGRAPLGDRTNWFMHEYRLCDEHTEGVPNFKGDFALCRVVRKNDVKVSSADSHVGSGSSNTRTTNEPLNISNNQSAYSNPMSSPFDMARIGEMDSSSTNLNSNVLWISPEFILDSSKDFQNSMVSWQPYNQQRISSSSSYSNFNEDPGNMDYLGYYGNDDTQYEFYDHINPHTGQF